MKSSIKAMEDAEKIVRAVFDMSKAPMVVLDETGRIIIANTSYSEMMSIHEKKIENLRREAEAQVNRQVDISPEHSLSMLEIIQELKIHQAELEIQNDELMRAENEMTELYHEYHNLFEFAPFGYIILDAQGIVKQSNHNAAEWMETDFVHLQGKGLVSFLAPESEQVFYKARQAAAISRQTMSIDLPLTKKDGSNRWCRS